MTVWKKIFLGALFTVLASFVFAAPRTAAVDFSGTWLGTTNLPHFGVDELTLVLKKEKDSYKGTVVDTLKIIAPDTLIQNFRVPPGRQDHAFLPPDPRG